MKGDDRTSRRMLFAIVLALAVWGVLLALGSYLGMWDQSPQQEQVRDLRRFWVVIGVVAAFLGLWGGALAVRAARTRSKDVRQRESP